MLDTRGKICTSSYLFLVVEQKFVSLHFRRKSGFGVVTAAVWVVVASTAEVSMAGLLVVVVVGREEMHFQQKRLEHYRFF